MKAKGIFVRLRREGRRTVQTVKTAGEGAVLAQRGEWDWPIKGDTPDLALTAGLGLKPLAKRADKNDLVRRFASEIQRRIAVLRDGGSEIELALDRGVVRAGRRVVAVNELELELKSGAAGPLFALARELVALPGVSVAVASKAERGFALAERRPAKAAGAAAFDLAPSQPPAAVAAALLEVCASQAAANLALLAVKRQPEAAHQTRVAMRRLRAGLGVMKDVLPKAARKRLGKGADRLADALADARGYDVLVDEVLTGAMVPVEMAGDLETLRHVLDRARRAAWREAQQAARAPDTSILLLDMAELAGEQRTGSLTDEQPALLDMAQSQLDARLAHVLRHAEGLDGLGIDARHRLRLSLKRLRYAIDVFAALFPKKAVRPVLKTLGRLQDDLGAFNDAATAPALIAQAIASGPRKDQAALQRLALFLSGWAANTAERDWAKAKLRWTAFAATRPFWRSAL